MTIDKRYFVHCDSCGDEYHGQNSDVPELLENEALNDGWNTDSTRLETGHICPDCQSRYGKQVQKDEEGE